jgi:hypothetical protein
MPEAAVSGRARLVCANLKDTSEYYGTHDAGGLQNLHRPQPRGTFPERTLHAYCPRSAKLDGFGEECLKRGDEQDRDASHFPELLPKCDILVADFTLGRSIPILD